jgi:hypothetical protein
MKNVVFLAQLMNMTAQLTYSLYKNLAQEKDVWLCRDQQGLAA